MTLNLFQGIMPQNTFVHLEHDGKLLLVDSDGNGPQIPIKGRINTKGELGWLFRFPTISELEKIGIEWTKKGKYVLEIGESSIIVIKGMIEITSDVHLIKQGDKVNLSAQALLAKMGKKPFGTHQLIFLLKLY